MRLEINLKHNIARKNLIPDNSFKINGLAVETIPFYL